jgi:hypothetical protein
LNDRTRFRDAWDEHKPERQDEGVFYNEQERRHFEAANVSHAQLRGQFRVPKPLNMLLAKQQARKRRAKAGPRQLLRVELGRRLVRFATFCERRCR